MCAFPVRQFLFLKSLFYHTADLSIELNVTGCRKIMIGGSFIPHSPCRDKELIFAHIGQNTAGTD